MTNPLPETDTTDTTSSLTAANINEVLHWEHVPVTDSDSSVLAGAMLAPAMLGNGFGCIIRTNPDMDARFPDSPMMYTVFVAGCNTSGRAEVLAHYNPYEYMTANAIMCLLTELGDLDILDPVEEAEIFISHPSNQSQPPRKWYDLAGKLEDWVTSVVVGMHRFLDRINGNDNDKDEW
tara:strand:+ start:3013 stop:3546 length:534 start_codon:yes stop_codon:yes gene_type:complete